MTEEYNYPTVSEGSGKRNNDDANIYVDSDACDSHRLDISIPEEIAPAFGVLRTDTAFMNMVSQIQCNIICAMT